MLLIEKENSTSNHLSSKVILLLMKIIYREIFKEAFQRLAKGNP